MNRTCLEGIITSAAIALSTQATDLFLSLRGNSKVFAQNNLFS